MSVLWTGGAVALGSEALLHGDFETGGTTITADATIHTKGSWTQIVASTPFDVTYFLIGSALTNVSGDRTGQLLDLGIGTSSNEKVLVANIPTGYSAVAGDKAASFPIFIPKGTRVAARMQAFVTVDVVDVFLQLFGGRSWMGETFQTVDTIGALTAASGGTDLSGGGIVEMVASSANDYKALGLVFDLETGSLGGAERLVEIFVGAGAAEKALISKIDFRSASTENVSQVNPFQGFYPMRFNIPSGTRLSAQAVGTRDCGLVMFGYR